MRQFAGLLAGSGGRSGSRWVMVVQEMAVKKAFCCDLQYSGFTRAVGFGFQLGWFV